MNWAAGSFVFVRSDGFREVGGFDEEFFAAEEVYLSVALKKWCRARDLRFAVLKKQRHASSSRKFRIYSWQEILKLWWDVTFAFRRTTRSRAALDFFYDGRR